MWVVGIYGIEIKIAGYNATASIVYYIFRPQYLRCVAGLFLWGQVQA